MCLTGKDRGVCVSEGMSLRGWVTGYNLSLLSLSVSLGHFLGHKWVGAVEC